MGGSPQLPEPVAQWVPQRVKVENVLYIVHSSGPRRVHRHQCNTTYTATNVIPPIGAVAGVKVYRAISRNLPPTFHRGGQKLAHSRVNLGPRHISERDRKLKFYTHTHRQVQVLFQGMEISTPRGVQGVQRPLVQIWDPLLSRKLLELEG